MLYLLAMIVVVLLYGHRGYQDSDDDGNDDVVTGDHQDDNADDHDAEDAVDAGEVIVGLERFLSSSSRVKTACSESRLGA